MRRPLSILIAAVLASAACTGTPQTSDTEVPSGPPRYRFADVTAAVGIPTEISRTWGSVWADQDSDGWPELFVNRHARPPWLLDNAQGEFSLLDVRGEIYPGYTDRHGCTWGEANGDGIADLYCVVGAVAGTGVGPNQMLVRIGDGFENHAADLGVEDEQGRGRSANWIDHDGDGDLDLFVGNKRRSAKGPGGITYGNVFFERTETGFERADVGLDDLLATASSNWMDWDADGDPDLLVLQYRPGPAVAYENVGGTFERVELDGVTGDTWWSAAWGEIDGDGLPDLHTMSLDRSVVWRNTGDGFEPVFESSVKHGRMSTWLDVENDGDLDLFLVQGSSFAKPTSAGENEPDLLLLNNDGEFERRRARGVAGAVTGFGDAVSAADFDRDGDVDLFVTNGMGERPASGPSTLLENRSRFGGSFTLRLAGTNWNPHGYGATIEVTAGDLHYVRMTNDGFNFRSQDEPGIFILGIGRAPQATVQVTWPDGTVDCVTAETGTRRTLEIGSRACS